VAAKAACTSWGRRPAAASGGVIADHRGAPHWGGRTSACQHRRMGLHAERRGTGRRLVLLHGFTQTGRCWGPLGDDLARDHEVVALDAPGHGGSSEVRADLPAAAALAVEAVESVAVPPAAGGAGAARPPVWVGYSMGARLALHVALGFPEAVGGLVLVGGTPGIEDDAERAERRARDAELAAALRADGVDAFLERWLALPLFAGLPAWARFDAERRRNSAEGLASSLELAGTGAQRSLWPRLAELRVPTLVVAGAADAKFAAIADRMAAAVGPAATARHLPGAGHAAHLERPAAALALLRSWLHRSFADH
jgi:2-succinyl-6-hydroxy-2,4-cyclohexadiene-1-carboxylate synthase